ncbi:hypothetical protein EYC84_001830 [Monilinia fructicola]|uniref:Uncharacterized protein n=1 Tax=Monilinia fructicola TaxID=38448 RepID=A0A5M9JVG5_MONFR|nr:hypothetical protein EYC84_001830 [Monilinia fructicola]
MGGSRFFGSSHIRNLFGLAEFRTLVAAHILRNSHVLRLWDEKCSPNIGFSEWGLGKHEGNWNEPMNLVV